MPRSNWAASDHYEETIAISGVVLRRVLFCSVLFCCAIGALLLEEIDTQPGMDFSRSTFRRKQLSHENIEKHFFLE
jgi:hypothetical protein